MRRNRVNRPLAPHFVFRIRRHLSSAIGGVFAVTSLASADIPEYRLLSGHRTFIHMLEAHPATKITSPSESLSKLQTQLERDHARRAIAAQTHAEQAGSRRHTIRRLKSGSLRWPAPSSRGRSHWVSRSRRWCRSRRHPGGIRKSILVGARLGERIGLCGKLVVLPSE
jgi:hypothetical protein